MRRLKSPLWVPALVLVAAGMLLAVAGLSRMAEETQPRSPYYALPVAAGEVDSAEQLLMSAVVTEISRTTRLEEGYPRTGRVVLTPSPGQPGASNVNCEQIRATEGRGSCIRLNPAGDLIQFSLWRDPSQMPFAYALYLVEPGRALDLYQTPWIMVQVMAVRDAALFQASHAAVESALRRLGARSFVPKY